MTSILCFGDSNTWGFNPADGSRFPYNVRWTTVLQKELGDGFNVIPEGLNGRTTVFEDPFGICRNGIDALPFLLLSHKPVDLLVVMLGTNDCKNFFGQSAFSIGKGMRRIVETAAGSLCGPGGSAVKVLVISPPHIRDYTPGAASFDAREFEQTGGHSPVEVSRHLSGEYRHIAAEYGCGFLDAAEICRVSGIDGVHLDADGHAALGSAVCRQILRITGREGQ